MKKYWKDILYVATLVVAVLLWWRDEAKDQAVLETKLNVLIENDEKQEEYIDRQNEINGKFLILYDYFITGPGTEENP